MRKIFVIGSSVALIIALALSLFVSNWWWILMGIVLMLTIFGYYDMIQKQHSIMRTFPLVGRLRYWMEDIRPKIYQYFVESDTDGKPISRIDRSSIYQRAKLQTDTMPFGTQLDVYAEGYEWIMHSIAPKDFNTLDTSPRLIFGNKDCKQPYSASIFNVSAMSYGSLSSNAIEALNGGAKIDNFAHNTGEGGISPYHLKHEGDLIWQIGTGYFGCRNEDGSFSAELFAEKAKFPTVKMIELKISQGAKPGHGGILPASKNTPEIAAIRHVQIGTVVASPPFHSAFDTPKEMVLFLKQLRDLSGGKPVGFKLCIGRKSEFIAICKAMIALDIYPDFITVDGAEGGTGAAPQEFSNYVGVPLLDGLAFVDNMLNGMDIRHHIKLIASGKVLSGFHIVRAIALGADACNSARAMMMALGCIQALLCNTNKCPTGVATQDPSLVVGLDVNDKKYRVANYHRSMLRTFAELMGACGIDHYKKLSRSHIYRRVFQNEMRSFEEIYPSLDKGCLLRGEIPEKYVADFEHAHIDNWGDFTINPR
ncbi:FMN-binding glutamate synthase family protein [Arachidicoccus soli]|uniref:FMN-binding glutamate synthase family protein n=1 Tax=Arachidicoccus soli TaxID=2341117 RepID=A0A386HTF4_9BACT|nr:FMN-binding glutamate synthase family protein [Arachidicoccus soli]AYD48690.1 FMN-binding glutamate synthase family protein [Arachidicoccus soli]